MIERQGLRKYTSKTVTTPAKLKRRIEEVKKQGFAIADGEYKTDLCAIAVPVWDHSGQVAASLMTAVPSDRISREKRIVDDLLSVLRREALHISKRIGYTGQHAD